MIIVFSSLNAAEVYLVGSLLRREGIVSTLRGEMRSGLAGQVPVDDARVELLVAPGDRAAAEAVIACAQRSDGPDRSCPACGEANPPAFELCWQCGAEIPDS